MELNVAGDGRARRPGHQALRAGGAHRGGLDGSYTIVANRRPGTRGSDRYRRYWVIWAMFVGKLLIMLSIVSSGTKNHLLMETIVTVHPADQRLTAEPAL